LDTIADDPNVLTEKEKLLLKIRSKSLETIANLLENSTLDSLTLPPAQLFLTRRPDPHTTIFADMGGLACLLSYLVMAKPSEDRKEAIRALLYLSENGLYSLSSAGTPGFVLTSLIIL
jgi:hypothetical protein